MKIKNITEPQKFFEEILSVFNKNKKYTSNWIDVEDKKIFSVIV